MGEIDGINMIISNCSMGLFSLHSDNAPTHHFSNIVINDWIEISTPGKGAFYVWWAPLSISQIYSTPEIVLTNLRNFFTEIIFFFNFISTYSERTDKNNLE